MSEIQSRSFQPSVNASLKDGFQSSRVASNDGLIPVRKLNDRFGFVRGLFLLVRQKGSWSPVATAVEFWRFLINIGAYREIRSVLQLRPFDEILQNSPGLAFKFVVPDYLVRGFTVTERAASFLHHYKRIHATFPEDVLRQILQRGFTVHEFSNRVNCFALTMDLPEPISRLEGELSLNLRLNGKRVFNLSFIIVPGWVVKSEAAEILLITRIQGTKGCKAQIRLLRTAFHEYSPKILLLAALQGVADAFGIGEIEAVCASKQRSYAKEYSAFFKSCYDDFFTKVGMCKSAAGYYACAIPIESKPLASFKGPARRRARKRRAMRQQIRSGCAAFLLGETDRAAHSSSGAMNSSPVREAVGSRLSPIPYPAPD